MENHQPITNTSAVILTGGKSSRMGRPKALLPFDGEPLIAHIVRKLGTCFRRNRRRRRARTGTAASAGRRWCATK